MTNHGKEAGLETRRLDPAQPEGMKRFRLRSWITETSIASQEYEVLAPNEEAAVAALTEAQQAAQERGTLVDAPNIGRIIGGSATLAITEPGVRVLSPDEPHGARQWVEPLGTIPPTGDNEETETREYLVEWRVEVDAPSPRAAADLAKLAFGGPGPDRTVLHVTEQGSDEAVMICLE
jgi:hypothetical protein